ncbi:NADPH2:quinone reductase [Sphingomonas sp. YR710]|uniref:quinone oxidoreductase family protein n=1 Tax=Sphingomonas sp. YR710 TaxID=1882773 RepID=UPI00088010D2|nr:quinone oxidoreductase [Sphingomonas sp. YR710]SDC33823.1 NADPH2:quinone reductase [Sphingomonas sp. YR710]
MTTDFQLVAKAFGGPEMIVSRPCELVAPGPNEVRVRHHAIGVNFIDIYHRTGLYPQPLPAPLGGEAAGVIEAIGESVTGFAMGQRVGYVSGPGSYATVRTIAADLLIPLPPAIDDELAAASMLKGMTAEFLIHRCAAIRPGQIALVHAAAGGVGIILVQWMAALGIRVIAHAGSAQKAAMAHAAGAEIALDCPYDELPGLIREHCGDGVDVSFDGVGAASWQASLASLRRRGLMISFGNASGAPAPFSPGDLSKAGSLFLTRPTLFDYIATPEERRESAERLFNAMENGSVKIEIGQRFALADAASAHIALEGRKTTGSTILTV